MFWRNAEKLGMPLEKVRKVPKIAKEPLSLETPIGDAMPIGCVGTSPKTRNPDGQRGHGSH